MQPKMDKKKFRKNLNESIHPRNPYFRNPPDFSYLMYEFEEFRKVAIVREDGKISLDFDDPTTVRVLTQSLLKSDFDLDVGMPANSLVPGLTQRLNYLCWCEDIAEHALGTKTPNVVDFGCGSTCIISLLGSRHFKWDFLAVEANAAAFANALENVARNNLRERVRVIKTSSDSIRFSEFLNYGKVYDMFMCNPPFYQHSWEQEAAFGGLENQEPKPSSFAGTSEERETSGGEVEFVKRCVEESENFKGTLRIGTAMLGKRKDFKELKTFFWKRNIDFTSTEFCQGHLLRWGIAWTFDREINLGGVPRIKFVKRKEPFILRVPPFVPGVQNTVEAIALRVKELLMNVQVMFKLINAGKNNHHIRVWSETNTLAGQRRRRRAKERMDKVEVPADLEEELAKIADEKATLADYEMTTSEEFGQGEKRQRTPESDTDDFEFVGGEKREHSDDEMDKSYEKVELDESSCEAELLQDEEADAETELRAPANKRMVRRPKAERLFLECDVRIRRVANGVEVHIQNCDVRSKRDATCQLKQYLRNNLCAQPKDLALTMKMLV